MFNSPFSWAVPALFVFANASITAALVLDANGEARSPTQHVQEALQSEDPQLVRRRTKVVDVVLDKSAMMRRERVQPPFLSAIEKRASSGAAQRSGCPDGAACTTYNSSLNECPNHEEDIDSKKLTIAFFMERDGTDNGGGTEVIRCDTDWVDHATKVLVHNGKLVFEVKGNTPLRQTFDQTFDADARYEVAISYDAEEKWVKLYVAGHEVEEKTYTHAHKAIVSNGRLGCAAHGHLNFQGVIENFYTVAVTYENEAGGSGARRRRSEQTGGPPFDDDDDDDDDDQVAGDGDGDGDGGGDVTVAGDDDNGPSPVPAPVPAPTPSDSGAPSGISDVVAAGSSPSSANVVAPRRRRSGPITEETTDSVEVNGDNVRDNWCDPWEAGTSVRVDASDSTANTGVSYFPAFWPPDSTTSLTQEECWEKCTGDDACEQAVYRLSGIGGAGQCWLGTDTLSTDPGDSGFPNKACDDCNDKCFAKNGYGYSIGHKVRPGYCSPFTEGYGPGNADGTDQQKACNKDGHQISDLVDCSHWGTDFDLSEKGCFAKCDAHAGCMSAVYSAKTTGGATTYECWIGIQNITADPGESGWDSHCTSCQDTCYAKHGFR